MTKIQFNIVTHIQLCWHHLIWMTLNSLHGALLNAQNLDKIEFFLLWDSIFETPRHLQWVFTDACWTTWTQWITCPKKCLILNFIPMKLKELKPEKCLEGLIFNKIVMKGMSFFLTSSFADVSYLLMFGKWEMPSFLVQKPDPHVSVQVCLISCWMKPSFPHGIWNSVPPHHGPELINNDQVIVVLRNITLICNWQIQTTPEY